MVHGGWRVASEAAGLQLSASASAVSSPTRPYLPWFRQVMAAATIQREPANPSVRILWGKQAEFLKFESEETDAYWNNRSLL